MSTPNKGEEAMGVCMPLKELTENEGFDNLPKLKDVLVPLKEVTKGEGFEELGSLKDLLIPIKDLEFLEPIHGKASKEASKSGDDKSSKSNEDK